MFKHFSFAECIKGIWYAVECGEYLVKREPHPDEETAIAFAYGMELAYGATFLLCPIAYKE